MVSKSRICISGMEKSNSCPLRDGDSVVKYRGYDKVGRDFIRNFIILTIFWSGPEAGIRR